MRLDKDLREFVELFNSRKVEFVVVGAHALAYHGHPRYTGDLDLLVRPSGENARRVVEVLAESGFGSFGLTEDDFAKPDHVIQLGYPPNRIDLLTGISGVTFDEVWQSRENGTLDEHSGLLHRKKGFYPKQDCFRPPERRGGCRGARGTGLNSHAALQRATFRFGFEIFMSGVDAIDGDVEVAAQYWTVNLAAA